MPSKVCGGQRIPGSLVMDINKESRNEGQEKVVLADEEEAEEEEEKEEEEEAEAEAEAEEKKETEDRVDVLFHSDRPPPNKRKIACPPTTSSPATQPPLSKKPRPATTTASLQMWASEYASETLLPTVGKEIKNSELRLLRQLGRGQYGTVYEGECRAKRVAVKVFEQGNCPISPQTVPPSHPDLWWWAAGQRTFDQKKWEAYLDEIQIMAYVSHRRLFELDPLKPLPHHLVVI